MRREQRTNRFGGRGSRPPAGDDRIRWVGGRYARPPALPVESEEEVGLTVVPPSRYRSLLVPVDGTPFGEHALPLALGIARRAGASVRLVHVHSPLESAFDSGLFHYSASLDDQLRQRQRDYLDGLKRRLAKVTSVPVVPLPAVGREVILTLGEVAGVGTDLVVMASHRRGLLGRLWYGSVADPLMRRLTVPLLLVRGYDAPVDLTGDPAPRHVLIPLDGTPAGEAALAPALDLGRLTGARHTLLRVLHPGRPVGERPHAEAWNYLCMVRDRSGERASGIDPRLLSTEKPIADSVAWAAREYDADLIALTTRGRGPLSRLSRGSVAEQVIREAHTPVLIVRTTP